MKKRDCAVLIFGVNPSKIGSVEMFAREIAVQLNSHGWKCVLCFAGDPPQRVQDFLQAPGVTIELVSESHRLAWQPTRMLTRVLRKHRRYILHLNFTGMLSPYPWLARLFGVGRVLFTDQGSRAAGYVPARATPFKRVLSRFINHPLYAVVAASDFGYRCLAALDILNKDRIKIFTTQSTSTAPP